MKKPKAPKLVTVAIITTITIVIWVFFSVYRVLTKEPETSVPSEILAPINPTLNTNSLDSLETRIYFEEGEVVALPTPTPQEETEEVENDESEELEEETQTQEATQSSSTNQ